MTIKKKSEMKPQPIEIDLTGPDGNAFALMGKARNFARQLGWSPEEVTKMLSDMQSGDYEHLVGVLEAHFGDWVTIYR